MLRKLNAFADSGPIWVKDVKESLHEILLSFCFHDYRNRLLDLLLV